MNMGWKAGSPADPSLDRASQLGIGGQGPCWTDARRAGYLQLFIRCNPRLYCPVPESTGRCGDVGMWALRSDPVPTGWVPGALMLPMTGPEARCTLINRSSLVVTQPTSWDHQDGPGSSKPYRSRGRLQRIFRCAGGTAAKISEDDRSMCEWKNCSWSHRTAAF